MQRKRAFAGIVATGLLLLAAIAQLQGVWLVQPLSSATVFAQPASDQRGPRIDTVRWKVTRSPAAQLLEMTLGPPDGSDMWMGMISPTDVEAMNELHYSLSARSMSHFCEFGFNMRNPPLDDVNFRHALAHLVPKEKIIGTLFKYICIPISTPVPPAQGLWYNPYVDPQPYSRTEAEAILAAAGYHKVSGEWKMPDYSDMPPLRVYVPLEIVAPTTYTIGVMFVEECHAIGLANVNLEPMDFSTYMSLVLDEWDFDIFWMCWQLGRYPTHLYYFFHSSQNYHGSRNCYGINWPELDAEIETFFYGLDHPAKVVAVKKIQEMLMGGSTSDPLAMPAQAGREQAIPLIPVYSRNAYDAQYDDWKGTRQESDDEGLRGAINMYGEGIDNIWTYMNLHWNTPDECRPGTTQRMAVPILEEYPETLNPTSADTPYAWTLLNPAFDGLIATNPWTHRDVPWLATSWSYAAEPGGMYIQYDLRTTDSHGEAVKWQDGDPIDPSDVTFAWHFLHDNQILDYWGTMAHYISSEYTGNTITAHMDTTSQWYVYSLAGTALSFPPQVWEPWDGQPTADIEAWDPSAEAGPGGLPTKVYGTGPFILQHSTTHVGENGYGDLHANRDYWLTTDEIISLIEEMFWRAGDVDRDGLIWLEDVQAICLAYGATPTDPRWNPDADISGPAGVPDEEIGIDDLATCCRFFGETMAVPPGELPSSPEAPTPVISVDPPLVTGLSPGDSFAVDIIITDALDVHAWQFAISYDPEVLAVIDVVEGDFLMMGGDAHFVAHERTYGQYLVASALFGDVSGVSGDGVLATVAFTVLDVGECPLDLEHVLLRDPYPSYIGCTVEDGYFVGAIADLIPPDLPSERPKGGGKDMVEWMKTMIKRWGTIEEFTANVTNLSNLPLWTRIQYTSTHQHTGETVMLYSGQEYIPTVTQRTEVLYVNEEIPLFDMWTKYGTSPYLDAPGDGSYIEANAYGMLSNAYGFEDVTLGPCEKIINVKLEGYTLYPGGADSEMDIDTYCFTPADYEFWWLGSLYGDGAWGWHIPRWIGEDLSDTVPVVTTEAGLNDVSILFYYWTADGNPHGDMRIDSARLVVTIETGGLYQQTGPWYLLDPGVTIELPPALWHLEKQNSGKWYTTISMQYMYYPPETSYAVGQTGKTTFTYEWWIRGEVED